jgi:hypothetical protein
MKLVALTSILLLVFLVGCHIPERDQLTKDEKIEFIEVRLTRSGALYGGETFVLRRIGNEWSGKLLGDGERFSCFYQRNISPRSGDWDRFYNVLLNTGLLEISGTEPFLGIEDGDRYELELTVNGRTTRYSVRHPNQQQSESAKKIVAIGNLISENFDTPVFAKETDHVSTYLIENCKEMRK